MGTTKNQKRNKKEKLSFEMILRRSFLDTLKEYIHNCSLAGAKQMSNPNINNFQRLIWITLFCVSLGTVCYYLLYIWSDLLRKPLIVTMESAEYPIQNIDFPAVAICSINRISKKALEEFAAKEFADMSKKELVEVKNTLLNLGRLIDYSYNDSLRNHPIFVRMVDKYRLDSHAIVDLMKTMSPSCNDILRKCAWDGKIVDCMDIFYTRRIANRGHCCTFNYIINLRTFSKLEKSYTIEVQRQGVPGVIHGLNVILDPMLDDYAYPLRAIQGFDVFIFDPKQFADPSAGRVIHRIVEPSNDVFMELSTTKQVATKEVRKYALETRKCYFHNEVGGKFTDMYSYSTCIILCKLETLKSLCKCTPYFYAAAAKDFISTHVCTLENLKCLNKYREKLYYLYPFNAEDSRGLEMELEDSLECPTCLPDCEINQHKTKSFQIQNRIDSMIMNKAGVVGLFKELNISTMPHLSVYYPTHDATLVKLDVVSYWYEIVSSLGGFCGLCVGFSITSAVEIVYFFTIRYVRHCRVNYKKYH